jgi:alkaline phosphatase
VKTWTDESQWHGPLISRRGVLAGIGASAAAWSLGTARAGTPSTGAPAAAAAPAPARNLILFVVDGMAMGTLALADQYRRTTQGRALEWTRLAGTRGVTRAFQSTHSADGVVTDSAAASSAWSTGRKHENGALCVLPDARAVEPFFARARRAGKATAAVTTTTITHATPGGFYANVPDRDRQAQIGSQLVERPVDVALGGGAMYVDAGAASAAGIRVVTDRAGVLGEPASGRTIGLLARSHVPLVLDRDDRDASLAEMTRHALKALAPVAGSTGFVLQVEAGRVDQAAHYNDAAALLREMLEADEVLGLLAEYCAGRPDTLLIATSDHATANPGPTWYGREGTAGMKRLADAKHSFEWIEREFAARQLPRDAALRGETLAELLSKATGLTYDENDRRLLRRFFEGERVQAFTTANTPVGIMGGLAASKTGVAFLSPNHTADHTEVLALGPGSERLSGTLDNTDLHQMMVETLGLPA